MVFVCGLFVSRGGPLVGWGASARAGRLCVLSHGGGSGRGWVPVGPVWAPQCFCADRSGAVLLLWFLALLAVCVCALVRLLCWWHVL